MEVYQKVLVEDMTAEVVLSLWLRGELYVKPKKLLDDAMLLALRQREALEYVAVIDGFVAPEWQACIHELWQAIVGDPLFTDDLLMKKGEQLGKLNRYFLTNIVSLLREWKIYQCKYTTTLHYKLEDVDEKNSVYKSAGAYPLSRTQQQRLLELKKMMESKIKVFRPE